MRTLSRPVQDRSETVVTGIYIARGDDTLGPYTSLEAKALVADGRLRTDDYAARDGDTAWVPLAQFLPLPDPIRDDPPARLTDIPLLTSEAQPLRVRHSAAFLVPAAILLAVVGGVRWFADHRAGEPVVVPTGTQVIQPRHATTPASTLLPQPSAATLPVAQAAPTPEVTGPLNGSLSCILPSGEQTPLAGVKISVYPLPALEPSLEQENAEVQSARARLDPQIAAAAAERTARAADAQSALRTYRESDPADPMRTSLRFASEGARTAARTAEDDYRYLVDERAASAGGEVYFRALPSPAATSETDAQGHFTLPILPGTEPFAVAASARQTADDGTVRLHYWLVKLSPAQRAGREPLRLDDADASTSSAAESLIHTAD